MSDLRILVVENADTWQEELRRTLARMGAGIQVDVAPNYEAGIRLSANEVYDLAIIDQALLVEPNGPPFSDELRKALLRNLRNSDRNQACGLIVLSGYSTKAGMRLAFRDYEADDVIDKAEFDNDAFIRTAREVIVSARLRRAAARRAARYYLSISFSHDYLLRSELTGPGLRAVYTAERASQFDAADLSRRGDNLNLLVLKGGVEVWRPEARSVGSAVYNCLASDQHLLEGLTTARALVPRASDLWVQFSGPAVGLGIPFELMRDADEYLVLNHILSRRVAKTGFGFTREFEPFHEFLHTLYQHQQALRILIVGANSDGWVPKEEAEALALQIVIAMELERLGIDYEITVLTGDEATYTNVREALANGNYHIFHYAGHGRFEDHLPEISGLVLKEGKALRTLTAGDLSLLTRNTKLRLVFLSCCLGGRSASQAGRGDFHGVFDALSHAEVPIVIGYRWVVADVSAILFARNFYQTLWRTLSPGEALLEARRNAATGPDDETWASPVLLMQNV